MFYKDTRLLATADWLLKRIAACVPNALSLVFSILVAACVSTPPISHLKPAPEGITPDMTYADTLPAYRFQVGDVIGIKFLLNPEMNEEVTVAPDGTISTQVADDIMAYGRTAKQLRRSLTRAYKDVLDHPRLSVILRSFAPNRIYVTGEVNSPGEFITVGPNLTLLQAISRAGGLKNSARVDDIVILRRGAGDKPVAYSANYKASVSGKDPAGDVRLAPYDIVYVPRSGVGDIYLYFQQYLQQFVPVSFGASYLLNQNGATSVVR